jgi:hypothetical protein
LVSVRHLPRTARELGLVDELAADPMRVARERLERLAPRH